MLLPWEQRVKPPTGPFSAHVRLLPAPGRGLKLSQCYRRASQEPSKGYPEGYGAGGGLETFWHTIEETGGAHISADLEASGAGTLPPRLRTATKEFFTKLLHKELHLIYSALRFPKTGGG